MVVFAVSAVFAFFFLLKIWHWPETGVKNDTTINAVKNTRIFFMGCFVLDEFLLILSQTIQNVNTVARISVSPGFPLLGLTSCSIWATLYI